MAEPQKVLPRHDPSNYTEQKFDRVVNMGDVIISGRNSPLQKSYDVIDAGYEQTQPYEYKNGKVGAPISKEQQAKQAAANRPIGESMDAALNYTPQNCPTCQGKATVQPKSRAMVEWECAECGANFVNRNV